MYDNTFTQNYGATFTLGTGNAVAIPNGCYLQSTFDDWTTGSKVSYNMGSSITQVAQSMYFDFIYHPTNYNITYDLDGGTNHTSNPSSYNVLYGVALQNPTRENYEFAGWYIGDTQVTGINEGCNATFSSTDDLYSKLASRTTGDITLTARWTLNSNAAIYLNGEWKLGLLHVYSNGKWNKVNIRALGTKK